MKTRLSNPYLAWLIYPVVLASAALPASAETLYWNGVNDGTTSWENILNWSTDSGATSPNPPTDEWPKADDAVIFNITSANATNQTIHLNATAQAANSLTFNSTGTTAIDNAAPPTTTATNLSLGSGGLTVSSGAGAVSIGGGDLLAVNGATAVLTTSAAVTHNGASSLNFGQSMTTGTDLGAITLTLDGAGITEYAQGIDQASGTALSLVIDGGRHYFRAPSTLTNLTINGGEILSRGSNQFSSVASVYFNGGALASVQSDRSFGNKFFVGGDIQLGAAAIPDIGNIDGQNTYVSTFNGDFDLTGGNRTITIIGGNILNGEILNGSLTVGAGSTGTLTLNGTNSYAGATTISGGTLVVSLSGNLGDADSDLVFDGGTLRVTGTALTSLADLGRTNPVVFNAGKTVRLDVVEASNTFTVGQVLNQTTGGFTKLGAGTAILDQTNTYTGTTTLGGGTLTLTTVDQTLSGGLTFGTAASNLNLNSASATFAGPMVVQTEDVTNTITIGAGEKLTINGNVTSGADTQSRLTVSGAGGWDVITSDGTFAGGGTGNNADFVVDMSGLTDYNANLRTGGSGADGGLFRIGPISKSGTNSRSHTVSLATSSTISADTISLSMSGAPGTSSLKLGNGTQIMNSDNITVGGSSRESAVFNFRTVDGTVKIRGTDGGNATRSNLRMLTGSTGSGSKTSTFDVTGHEADLLFDSVKILDHTASASSSTTESLSATFSFDRGTLDATTFQIGTKSAGDLNMNNPATANIGSSANLTNSATFETVAMGALSTGGTIDANGILRPTLNITGTATTVNFSTISMANSTSADVDADVVSEVNISGGSVTGTGGIDMVQAFDAGTGNSTLNITGGSLSVGTGGIFRTSASANATSTLVLSGGSLDLNDNAIGGAGASAITTQFESGTLSNVGEINGGAGLTKTTAGTLTLAGTNTYTGTTAVTEGTLSMSSPSLADASAVTIAAGAVLNLEYMGTDTIGSLSVGGGSPLANGTYDKDSPETTGFITGDGELFVNAVASPYDNWVALYQPGFTNNLPAQDQDGDGLTNQEEFAFGLNPKSGSSINPITTGLDTATGNFSFTRNANSGLNYKVWSSTDLATWTPRTGATQTPVGTPDGFGTQTVNVTNLGATAVGGKLFVRVTAE